MNPLRPPSKMRCLLCVYSVSAMISSKVGHHSAKVKDHGPLCVAEIYEYQELYA